MLTKYHEDSDYIICWEPKLIDKNFSSEEEPIAILDKDVIKLRNQVIHCVRNQVIHYVIQYY